MSARSHPHWPAARFRAGAVLVALALLLRVLVPAGFMPAASVAGEARFAITICDGEGGHTIALPGHPRAPADPRDASTHAVCPFAAFALAAAAVFAPELAMPLPVAAAAAWGWRVLSVTVAAPRWRPPGRAPPLHA